MHYSYSLKLIDHRLKVSGSATATWLGPRQCQVQLIYIFSRRVFVHCGRYDFAAWVGELFSSIFLLLCLVILLKTKYLFMLFPSFRILLTAMVVNGLLDLKSLSQVAFGKTWYGKKIANNVISCHLAPWYYLFPVHMISCVSSSLSTLCFWVVSFHVSEC